MNRYQSQEDHERMLLKRNKHFVDIKKLEFYDRRREILNRVPEDTDTDSALNQSIYKNKFFQKTHASSFTKSSKQPNSSKHIRGLSMNLSLPRKSFISEDKGPVTERNFNNFYLQRPNMTNTMDISKCLGRDKYNVSPTPNEIGDDLTKKYEQFYYSTPRKCLVNYKLDISEARTSLTKRREKEKPATDLDDDKVYSALLKVRRRSKSPLLFSKSLGKDIPSSLDRRLLKDNQYYWEAKEKGQGEGMIAEKGKLRSIKRISREPYIPAEPSKDEVCCGIYYRRKKEPQGEDKIN